MRRAAILCIVLAGCDPAPETVGVLGSRSDVSTRAGSYSGYRVVMACPTTAVNVGVIGTGSVAVTDVNAIAHAGEELQAQLIDIRSIWGSGGYGLVCEAGVGTSISLDDWRDVDAVIARAGAFLEARDLALQVGITVGSVPIE